MEAFRFLSCLCVIALASAAASPPTSSGTMSITMSGTSVSVPVYALGTQRPSGNTLVIPYNTRSYLGKPGSTWGRESYLIMPLLANTLSFTVDMTSVGPGCNAAIYTVTMPSPNGQAGQSLDHYCDANQVGGNWCAEMDLMEANSLANQITPHKCDAAAGPCDKAGCGVNSRTTGDWFRAGGSIDPKKGPIDMSFQFVGSGSQVTDIVTILTQGGNTQKINFGSKCNTSYLSAMYKDFANGQVLVFSYWGSQAGGMSWLDGDKSASCGANTGSSFTVKNIVLAGSKPPDLCSPNPCANGGTCNTGKCTCAPGWEGDTCSTKADPCSPNPCANGGTCTAGTCKCATGWEGEKCTTRAADPCSPNPCANGGTCTAGTCKCATGWQGEKCGTRTANTCSPACRNGGSCVAGVCQCASGWEGASCNTRSETEDPCSPNPCAHGGVCTDGTCKCATGWQGETCNEEAALPTCDDIECENGGTCMEGVCICPAEWMGDLTCSKATPSSKRPPATSGNLKIKMNGATKSVPVYANGKQQVSGSTVTIPYNTRSYLGKPGSTWGRDSYLVMPLLGQTLSFTVEMSEVRVGCNAAVYLVTMPAPNYKPGDSNDYYCDANQVGGNWCGETDLLEANELATQITPHKCDTPTGPCDKAGCSLNTIKDGDWFTNNGNGVINPAEPFQMSFSFEGSNGNVTEFTATVSQNGESVVRTYAKRCGNAYLSAMYDDFAVGQVLVFSYWGSRNGGMSWLDNNKTATCPGTGSFSVSDIVIGPTKPSSSNACASVTCRHGGTCRNGVCVCPAAWRGDDTCSTATDEEESEDDGNGSSGTSQDTILLIVLIALVVVAAVVLLVCCIRRNQGTKGPTAPPPPPQSYDTNNSNVPYQPTE